MCFALTFFSFASADFRIAFNVTSILICYLPYPFFYVSFLYYTAIYVALLLQILTPFIPERLKLCRSTHKICCVTFSEITSHLVIFLLLLSCYVLLFYHTDAGYIIFGISWVLFVLFLLLSLVLIFAFAFLIRFFKTHNINRNPLKYMIIKVFFLLNCIAFIITSVIATQLSFLFIQMVLYFILSILIASLNHPLDIWCCKCCCRRSPGRAPLLPVNDTEGQQTNPILVWDHRNVPSYTVTNLSYDMSDCRSDYEQLA